LSCTPRQAKAQIDTEQFQEFVLYFRDYPPINDHLTLLLGQVSHTVWSANWSRGKKRLKLKDFMPDYRKAYMTQEDKAREAVKAIRKFAKGNKYINIKEEA